MSNSSPNLPKLGHQLVKFKFQMNIPVTAPSHRSQNSELLTSVANKSDTFVDSKNENLSSSSPSIMTSLHQNSEERFGKKVTFSKSQSLEETRFVFAIYMGGAVGTTRGGFHILFCTLRLSFAPCTKLLRQ